MENLALVHKECCDYRCNKWQQDHKDLILEPGMWVKKQFTQDTFTEHIWVILTVVDGDSLTGTLDNDPFQLTNVKWGDIISFDRSEVEQHMIRD